MVCVMMRSCAISLILDCRERRVLRVIVFFKQKTAYEMRISDWSSDVCSSDLQHRREQAVRRMGAGGAARREDEGAGAEGRLGLPRREARLPDRRRLLVARHAADRDRAPEQVGDGGADGRGAAGNLGQQGPRYAKQVAQPLVPAV